MISEAFHIFGMISHTLARIHDTSQIRNPLKFLANQEYFRNPGKSLANENRVARNPRKSWLMNFVNPTNPTKLFET